MKTLEQAIEDGWGWAVQSPVAVVDVNAFGNVILCDAVGRYFRIIPEDLTCTFLTEKEDELVRIRESDEFKTDWAMQPLLKKSEQALGPLEAGQCYHLVLPSALGGAYAVDNVRKIAVTDWLGGAGTFSASRGHVHLLRIGSQFDEMPPSRARQLPLVIPPAGAFD